MTKKTTLIILYISAWVIIWGTIGSLIDFPLLQAEAYKEGSFYQYLTFFLTSLICLFLGIKLYSKIPQKYLD